jgi:hypothetical protein
VTCQDYSFGPSLYSDLANNPPTPLTHNYFECRKSIESALLASIGPAVASANFFSTLFWIVVGYFVIFAIRRQRGQTVVLSAHSKAVVGEALVTAKEESLVAVVQEMAIAVQSLRAENAALANKLSALERASSPLPKDEVGEATKPRDEILLQIPLQEALEQFQRLHRLQLSDHDFDLVGQAITRALHQHQGGGRRGEERDSVREEPLPTVNSTAVALEMVDNPMSVGGERASQNI